MIKACVLGLAAVLYAWTPANAQQFNLSIHGTVTGFQTTVVCGVGSTPSCLATYPGGVLTEEFLRAFDVPLYAAVLPEGDTQFTWGSPYANGLWSGVINNSAGYLTGKDLSFSYQSGACRTGGAGCQFVSAKTSSFNVMGGIPEPSTWVSMLLGFLLIGLGMRNLRGSHVRGWEAATVLPSDLLNRRQTA